MGTKKIVIQIGSADKVDRYDTNLKSKNWGNLIIAGTLQGALEQLIEGLNNDDIIMDNNFLRVIENDTDIFTF